MLNCFEKAKTKIKNTIFESRMDSAFFNQDILSMLSGNKIKFTASVPFERFTELKKMIEECKCWLTLLLLAHVQKGRPPGNSKNWTRYGTD
ncbi:hypothetical protein dsmv_0269 [Desulfococcus multivorans DSM 2059]|jgi:hypothetical protein|uniref:Transposase DDE domain-containing protein n=2 Tax=Desulfococcus multivorans TaxID=897 RepID=S7UXC7_DESML|nr:uncharacterized protein Dmul_10000 [Desulfococcus multivorans]EPR38859.1 hypothetical protein dsmv_0269 [Desulfococcus multivorans DSM 2059]SKA28085.1 hypothetical protein SAMN02745446_03757 [Desulfococcus multivorans DSM 2059]